MTSNSLLPATVLSSAIPWTIIPRECPEVSGLGFARARIKHRSTCLVHEELGRTLQVGDQRINRRRRRPGFPARSPLRHEEDALEESRDWSLVAW